jgi:hypothetical protein
MNDGAHNERHALIYLPDLSGSDQSIKRIASAYLR